MKNNTLFETFIIFILCMINVVLIIFTDEKEIILSGAGLTKIFAMNIGLPFSYFVIFNTWRNDNLGKLKYSWIVGLLILFFAVRDFAYLKYAIIPSVSIIMASIISLHNYRKGQEK